MEKIRVHEASGFVLFLNKTEWEIKKPLGRQLGRFNIVSKCKQHTEKEQPKEDSKKEMSGGVSEMEKDHHTLYASWIMFLWARRTMGKTRTEEHFWYVRMLFFFKSVNLVLSAG